MSMLPETKLDVLLAHHASLEAQSLGQVSSQEYVQITRELAELNPLIDAVKTYRAIVKELADTEALIADPASDLEMRSMAESERAELNPKIEELVQKIRVALLPKDAMDDRNVMLEIRAGTGGDEASLFAGDLFRMYERFASLQGWKVEVISASEGTMGGYKEIIAEVQGRGAFAKLKFESGVHRVQRVPDTETQGRIHTSAATVAVLPEVEDVDVDIKNDDLRIETMRAQGAGGQHVNKTESAIRITHIPTGIVVMMQDSRSQHKNRASAMNILRSRIYDAERQRVDAARSPDRKETVGSGDRSERSRRTRRADSDRPCTEPRPDRPDIGRTAPTHGGRIGTPGGIRPPSPRGRAGRPHHRREGVLGAAAATFVRDAGAAARYRDGGRTGAGTIARRRKSPSPAAYRRSRHRLRRDPAGAAVRVASGARLR